jgi:hypothetical protein
LELISLNDTEKWLNILEENKCFMKSKKEQSVKGLSNVFKKVRDTKLIQKKNLKENSNKKYMNDLYHNERG